MARLSNKTLEQANAAKPDYDRSKVGVGIVHIGPGAFHRAHQAFFTDEAIAKSGGDWGICGVSLNSRGATESLTPQDGLYTLAIKDKSPSYRIIGSVREVLCAKDDPSAVLRRLTSEKTKIVTLTITEKGYALGPDGHLDKSNAGIKADLSTPDAPGSAIGYLVEACRLRHAKGSVPLTIISCDNLPENGDKLRTACLEYASEIDPILNDFIAEFVKFPNTMVDSITPATDEGVISDVEDAIGLLDKGPVQRESFAQWVIEDNLPQGRPDWESAGVIITPDVQAFEKTKLRILNGAHSTLTYLGLMAGEETVEDAISNPVLSNFVSKLIEKETIPTIEPPKGLDLQNYWKATKARFENPHIRHLLEQISHDGSQKIPARIFPVIKYYAEQNQVAKAACFVVAGWIEFNRKRRQADDLPTDGYLTQISSQLPDPYLSASRYAESFLAIEGLFPAFILENSAVTDAIIESCEAIDESGVQKAMESLAG
jgi:fructuronate reductase